jgi:uncharacterized membrane protein YkvA (DUF1232 family)
MKIALCFLISGEHNLKKEEIWKKWIEPNKDIINIYFHYKDHTKIGSKWINEFIIPQSYIAETSYYHVVPAYMSLMFFATVQDEENQWFCMLTESCVPIISPFKFRELFFYNHYKSILSWKKIWWNATVHNRANLRFLKPEFHLGHSPYFVLCKKDLESCFKYHSVNYKLYKLICDGGLANESVFAIMLKAQNVLDNVINSPTHLTDWVRMSSLTSPHVFKTGNNADLDFLKTEMNSKDNRHVMFLRKVHQNFPDSILNKYIYEDANPSYKRIILLEIVESLLFLKSILPYVFFSVGFIYFIYYLPVILEFIQKKIQAELVKEVKRDLVARFAERLHDVSTL